MHPAGKGAAYYHQLSLQEDQGIDMTQVSWDTVPLDERMPVSVHIVQLHQHYDSPHRPINMHRFVSLSVKHENRSEKSDFIGGKAFLEH
jgi:hypothetical protein